MSTSLSWCQDLLSRISLCLCNKGSINVPNGSPNSGAKTCRSRIIIYVTMGPKWSQWVPKWSQLMPNWPSSRVSKWSQWISFLSDPYRSDLEDPFLLLVLVLLLVMLGPTSRNCSIIHFRCSADPHNHTYSESL